MQEEIKFTDVENRQYAEMVAQSKGISLTEGVTNLTVKRILEAMEARADFTGAGANFRHALKTNPRSTIEKFVDDWDRDNEKEFLPERHSAANWEKRNSWLERSQGRQDRNDGSWNQLG